MVLLTNKTDQACLRYIYYTTKFTYMYEIHCSTWYYLHCTYLFYPLKDIILQETWMQEWEMILPHGMGGRPGLEDHYDSRESYAIEKASI